ncbi:acetyltransferase [Alteromonas sp. a30]|uniref:acetyltransferase n=1 Tax=Alteromonas sp. a30 TaxID=2730917 RepID=UPI002281AB12|nr:acetyltransferase [Alteromonas sp. a30]
MGIIIFPIHFFLQLVTVSFYASSILVFTLLKLILPFSTAQKYINSILDWCVGAYGISAVFWVNLFNNPTWDYQMKGEPSKDNWYLLTSNHISYLDIILILNWSYYHIPSPKFFIKKELLFMPLVGQACWALDMPFMSRYNRRQVAKNPQLKNKDIETTRKHCEKFKFRPTTVINFVEGTRFTKAKQAKRNTQFKHLLSPKAGGIAFTLASMGELFTHTIDVTLQYPDNPGHVMIDMLRGQLKRIVIHVELVPIDKQLIGDYYNDQTFKSRFQEKLNAHWIKKDNKLEKLLIKHD